MLQLESKFRMFECAVVILACRFMDKGTGNVQVVELICETFQAVIKTLVMICARNRFKPIRAQRFRELTHIWNHVFDDDSRARTRKIKVNIQERNRTVVHLPCEIQSLRFYLRMPKFRPDPHLPPFPARTHALLPLCPSQESPCNTSSAAENYIIVKPATGSHCPAISRRRGRVAVRLHTRSKRPATPHGNT